MPIDVDKILGAELPAATWDWGPDQVILYHLGVGAGVPATDDNELDYTYEARLKVLPSFGVLPVFGMLGGMVGIEGMSFNPMMLLHGEQDITIHKPLPVQAKVESSGRIVGRYERWVASSAWPGEQPSSGSGADQSRSASAWRASV